MRLIDKSKKSNIKCEHCGNFAEPNGNVHGRMVELKCPCGLREHMDEEDCRKTLCCECCPLQKEDTNG